MLQLCRCYRVLAVPASISGHAPASASDLFSLPGGLFFYLKLALVGGVFLAAPVIFHQIWSFVAPGLYRHERRVLLPFTLLSTLCFVSGVAFAYLVVFPPAFKFLLGYGNEYLRPLPAVNDYFSLCLRLLLAFGIIFELPVFMVFLAKAGMVSAPFLRRNRKYAVLIAFIIAAILTPTPDVLNQVLMGAPLLVLYEISILAVTLFGRHKFADFAAAEEAAKNLASGAVEAVRAQEDTRRN